MIIRVSPDEISALLNACKDSAMGCRVASNLLAYGVEQPFAPFYLSDAGAVSILDGLAICHLTGEGDREELASFMRMNPQVSAVLYDGALPFPVKEEGAVMSCLRKRPFPSPGVEDTQDYHGVYRVLCGVPWMKQSLPPFDVWYVDVCHKVRHGIASMKAVVQDGAMVSVGMITGQSEDMGIIGGVATRENCRGRGFGSRLVCALTEELLHQGKKACLFRRQGENEAFYRSLGYETIGQWYLSEDTYVF